MRHIRFRHAGIGVIIAWSAAVSLPQDALAVELVRVVSSVDAAATVQSVATSDRGLVSFRRDGSNPYVDSRFDGILPTGVDVDALSVVDGSGLVFSTSVSFETGGVEADDEDLVLLDRGALSLVFDGSSHGLPDSADIDAVHVESLDPLDLYYSVDAPTKMGSIVISDDDIVRLHGGTHTVVRLGASLLGDAASRADVDALIVDPSNNQYVVSVDVPIASEGGNPAAEPSDLLLWANGALFLFFDASAGGLTSGSLDLDAAALDFAFFSDDFETGDSSMWASTTP